MFETRRFFIDDSVSSMKISTDSVALGTVAAHRFVKQNIQWNPPTGVAHSGSPLPPLRILDLGCGCGVASLLLADYCLMTLPLDIRIEVVGVDIDAGAVDESWRNFSAALKRNESVWASRLSYCAVVGDATNHMDMKRKVLDMGGPFDVVLSNPPYFDSRGVPKGRPMDLGRERARMRASLDTADVARCIRHMMRREPHSFDTQVNPNVVVQPAAFVIYPFPNPCNDFRLDCQSVGGLRIAHEAHLQDRPGHRVTRSILTVQVAEAGVESSDVTVDMIPIHKSAQDRSYSDTYAEYVALQLVDKKKTRI